MQFESQVDDLLLTYSVGACTPHQTSNSLDLEIVNDLEETYRPRYKSDYFTKTGQSRRPRYVKDRLGNHYVSLKVS